jgi:4-hydroxybenzoate polyprenyltransferase
VAWLAARAIAATYRSNDACSALFAFLVCSLLWDLLFSPYGAERRIVTPYYIVAAIMILRRAADTQSSVAQALTS